MVRFQYPKGITYEMLYETLRRIGHVSRPEKEGGKPVFWQYAHIYKNKGETYIAHYKQILYKRGEIKEEDYSNSNHSVLMGICKMLRLFGLIETDEHLKGYAEKRFAILKKEESKKYNLKSNLRTKNGKNPQKNKPERKTASRKTNSNA